MRSIILLIGVFGITYGQDYFRKPEQLISETRNVGDKIGVYSLSYETEGGILQKEIGSRKYAGTPDETQLIQGSVQYNAPDGTPISLSWTADEFGSQVSGSHLPTPPPIPREIQRALEWLKKQPSTEEPEYDEQGNPIINKKQTPIVKDPKQRNFSKKQ
ncbi:hypothetical protein HCN44_003094 [Aphidius gifuensis]|uniref:Cuticular protein n=2 Tax=Aphidius gifuensis TaxID=684658 RepID=A0A835CKL8_APHGI|nr:hypothetical protein HCN44_003094 [Aphidius gifuensis]